MAGEQPKKVTGGAFGRFLSEKRPEFLRACSGQPATAVVKLASERFKTLSEAEKAVYQKKYEQAVQQYNKDMEAFLAAGGEKKAGKRKADNDDKRAKKRNKDPEAPKKPAGGAFGCFLAKHRAEFMEQTKGKPITAVTKLASENWKQLSEVEKKPYEAAYTAKLETYKAAMKDYVPPEPKLDEPPKLGKRAAAKQAKEEAKQAKMQAKEDAKEEAKLAKEDAKNAKKQEKAEGKSAKAKAKARVGVFGRKSAKAKAKAEKPVAPVVELQATVAAKAEKEGLKEKLIQLASRQDIIDSKKNQTAILKALLESGGLIHPARRALLGA